MKWTMHLQCMHLCGYGRLERGFLVQTVMNLGIPQQPTHIRTIPCTVGKVKSHVFRVRSSNVFLLLFRNSDYKVQLEVTMFTANRMKLHLYFGLCPSKTALLLTEQRQSQLCDSVLRYPFRKFQKYMYTNRVVFTNVLCFFNLST